MAKILFRQVFQVELFFAFDANNNLTASFIMDGTKRILSFIFDWKIFGKLSGQITDESGSINSSDSTNSSDFVKQFDGLAQKLLQESKKRRKSVLCVPGFFGR